MIDYCHEQGWLFAYHQQYRDMYLDSPSCDRELLVRREDGTNHFETTWAGGRNGVLCSWLALDYVRRNNTFLADTGWLRTAAISTCSPSCTATSVITPNTA